MKPSALLITMRRYPGVASRLRDIKASAPDEVDVCVKTPRSFDDVPPLLRSAVDLVALDGHGWPDNESAYFGTADDPSWLSTPFCPEYLRSEHGDGIVAPIVVLGFCWGGTDPFRNAIEGSIDRSHVAFLGSTCETKYHHAERIYLPLLKLLARLGTNPDPATAHANLESIAPAIGPAWRRELLQRRSPRL